MKKEDLGQPETPIVMSTDSIGTMKETNDSYLRSLGIRLLGTRQKPDAPVVPVIGLSAEKWTVVDVDCDQGLGAFHRRLAANDLPGVAAYVLTDRGVLVVYPKKLDGKCDIDGDVRYERISRARGYYDMRCLFKRDGKARTMQLIGGNPSTNSSEEQLSTAWNLLARQAAQIGEWAQALQTKSALPSYEPAE